VESNWIAGYGPEAISAGSLHSKELNNSFSFRFPWLSWTACGALRERRAAERVVWLIKRWMKRRRELARLFCWLVACGLQPPITPNKNNSLNSPKPIPSIIFTKNDWLELDWLAARIGRLGWRRLFIPIHCGPLIHTLPVRQFNSLFHFISKINWISSAAKTAFTHKFHNWFHSHSSIVSLFAQP